MTDRTGKEHTMRSTATILGVAAALAIPAVASAGVNPQVVAQVKPQVKAQVVKTKISTAQAKRQIALARRVAAARARIPELGDQTIAKAPTKQPTICQGVLVSLGNDDRYGLQLYTRSLCGRQGGIPFG
jgi:acyl-coenzyme A synthetase/AMP-(fatty) acid ligase